MTSTQDDQPTTTTPSSTSGDSADSCRTASVPKEQPVVAGHEHDTSRRLITPEMLSKAHSMSKNSDVSTSIDRWSPQTPRLTVDDPGPQQWAALEQALKSARHAHTAEEFGAALKEVIRATELTQGEIVRRDGRTTNKLSKSTVSRMVNGTTIVRNRDQVEAFIRACGGVDTYVEAWGVAWEQLRAVVHEDRIAVADQDTVTPVDAEVVDTSTSPSLGDSPSGLKRWWSRWREPDYIDYEHRSGGDSVLEPLGVRRMAGDRPFIMVCGMGARTVWIRWYGRTVEDVRKSFRDWLAQPWQCLSTDFSGQSVPNGLDFKPSRIEWFGVVGD
jgi:hypothetical protein